MTNPVLLVALGFGLLIGAVSYERWNRKAKESGATISAKVHATPGWMAILGLGCTALGIALAVKIELLS